MSIVPLLSAGDIANLQTMERDVMLATAQAAGQGGSQWTVTRTSGDDRAQRPTEAVVATITGWVYRSQQQQIATPQAPDFTPVDTWSFVAATPVDVAEDDTLTSVADARQFQVMGVEPRNDYISATLEAL